MERIPDAVLAEASNLFWDVDPHALDPELHQDFILGRVLSKGSWKALLATRSAVGDAELATFVHRAPHRLDARSRRFFETVLGSSEEPSTTQRSFRSSAPLFRP